MKLILYQVVEKVFRPFLVFAYLYLGFGYIIQMIHKPINERKYGTRPSNFVFWIIGIYIGTYGIAFNRHENSLNRLYTLFGAYGEHVDNFSGPEVLEALADLQSQKLPREPEVFNPVLVYKSLFNRFNEPNSLQRDIAVLIERYMFQVPSTEISNVDFGEVSVTNFEDLDIRIEFDSITIEESFRFSNHKVTYMAINNSNIKEFDLHLKHEQNNALSLINFQIKNSYFDIIKFDNCTFSRESIFEMDTLKLRKSPDWFDVCCYEEVRNVTCKELTVESSYLPFSPLDISIKDTANISYSILDNTFKDLNGIESSHIRANHILVERSFLIGQLLEFKSLDSKESFYKDCIFKVSESFDSLGNNAYVNCRYIKEGDTISMPNNITDLLFKKELNFHYEVIKKDHIFSHFGQY